MRKVILILGLILIALLAWMAAGTHQMVDATPPVAAPTSAGTVSSTTMVVRHGAVDPTAGPALPIPARSSPPIPPPEPAAPPDTVGPSNTVTIGPPSTDTMAAPPLPETA